MRIVTVLTAGGPMEIHEEAPRRTPRGAVVVVQEAFGVTEHIQDVCRRLAAEGFHAVAPHLYHRSNDPVFDYSGGFSRISPHMQALTAEGVLADLDATRQHLESVGLPADRTGVVGFCMGGSVAFYTAVFRRFAAAVTFYGSGVAQGRFGFPPQPEVAPRLHAPWLGLYGDLDPSISATEVESLRDAAAQAQVPTEVVRYPDAGHGFHCDARPDYHPRSATDAWQHTLDWFDTHLPHD